MRFHQEFPQFLSLGIVVDVVVMDSEDRNILVCEVPDDVFRYPGVFFH